MKIIILNIRTFIKKEPIIFLILTLCVFLSSAVLCFSYGIFVNYQIEKQEMQLDMNSISANIQNNYKTGHLLTKGMLKDYLLSLSDNTKASINCFYCTSQLIPDEKIKECGYTEYDTPLRFTINDNKFEAAKITRDNWTEHGVIVSGRYFNDEEEAAGANVAIVGTADNGEWDNISLSLRSSDNTIILDGREYTVIGCSKAPFLPIVPFESISNDNIVGSFEINFSSNITASVYHDLIDNAESSLGDYLVYEELDIPDNNNKYLINNLLFVSVSVAVLAVLNFTIPYRYMMSKRSRTLAIFRMNGCAAAKAIGLFLVETLAVTIPACIISMIFYNFLMKNILIKIFPYIETAHSVITYTAIMAVYLVMLIIVLIALLDKFVHRDINSLIKET